MRLRTKIFLQVAGVVCVVVVISFLVNTFFMPKYFLYQKKHVLEALADSLSTATEADLISNRPQLEKDYNVTIASVSALKDMETLNWELKEGLRKRGVALHKFWLTEETLDALKNGKAVNKLYDQEKLKSGFLVMFVKKGITIFAFGDSIVQAEETLTIINRFHLYIWLGSLVAILVMSRLFARQIVKPIEKLQQTAEDIANFTYTTAQINTGDEFEQLAASINCMSNKIQQGHLELNAKNQNLQAFIANITHELKTPLALIKAYASGINDGLDDGTF